MKVQVTIEYEVDPKMIERDSGSTFWPSVQYVLNQERCRLCAVLKPLNLRNSIFKIKKAP